MPHHMHNKLGQFTPPINQYVPQYISTCPYLCHYLEFLMVNCNQPQSCHILIFKFQQPSIKGFYKIFAFKLDKNQVKCDILETKQM